MRYLGAYPEGYKEGAVDVVTTENQDQFVEPIWESRCPDLYKLAIPAEGIPKVSGGEFHPPVGWKVLEFQKDDKYISYWETLQSLLSGGKHWDMDFCSGVSVYDSAKTVVVKRAGIGLGGLLIFGGLSYLAYRIYKGK